ncbi:carboxy terminal-processing peptidase, partial [Aeromonas taiwanensis]|uniref:carboxy terminal-processing peptidase n=1 Tax=Aeromonas taiwanensis TaxID=633417 RepID=UPI00248E158F
PSAFMPADDNDQTQVTLTLGPGATLEQTERLAEQAKQDEKALARANERLTRLGKPVVKSLDELPADFEAPDEYQVEAANITADLASLSKKS